MVTPLQITMEEVSSEPQEEVVIEESAPEPSPESAEAAPEVPAVEADPQTE